MKIAIISVSKKGQELANILKTKLNKDSTIIKTDLYHKNIKKTFPLIFQEYDAIIAIMASGILIRSIAPLIQSKTQDPAIINIDDAGKYTISTLSGHLGGANKLTKKVSKIINSTEVITTSTDVNGKIGIDVIANDLYLSIENTKEILFFNKSILNEKEIIFNINPNKNFDYLFEYLNDNTLEINLSIIFTTKINKKEIHVTCENHKLILKEKKIVAGIGCKKNKKYEDIYNALKNSCNDLKIPISRVNLLSSAWIKKDEKGLLKLSNELNIPIKFISKDKLQLFKSPDTSKSEFVKSKIGIDGVCEQSSLIAAGFESKLIYKKTPYNGVTIALSVSN